MIKSAALSTSHSMIDDQSTSFMAHNLDYTYTGQLQQELGLYIQGTGNDDTLWGTGGNDGIYGLAGNDVLHGGMGKDILDGGDGNDILDGGAGADQLIGGSGIDTATYINATSGVGADLAHGGVTGDAQGDTYSGVENLTGSNFDDILVGDAGNNVINGGAGGDWIVAGAGNDTLIGGSGINVLNGGDGSDIFVIAKNDGSTNNVQDFQFNIDKVDLTASHLPISAPTACSPTVTSRPIRRGMAGWSRPTTPTPNRTGCTSGTIHTN